MNYFFSINNNNLKSKLTIPKFQNRGKYNKNLKLYSLKIKENNWIISEPTSHQDENFYYINNDFKSENEIYMLAEKKIKNSKYDFIEFNNNFLLTKPAFRCNLRVTNLAGGFSSYQSEYPAAMINKKGNIVSQVSSLLDPENEKNILIFKNIYFEPIIKSFKTYIVDIETKTIVSENEFFTNSLNFWELDKKMIKPSNFFFSEGYLGIPVYYSEKNKNVSLEHTHPLQTYILTQNMISIVKDFKNNVQTITFRKDK